MSLVPFLNRHAGETAWLFGKGQSLSTFDFKTAGSLRVAINDVIAHVPDCKYGFANDGVAKWSDVYKQGQTLFQPARCMGEYDSTKPDAVACDVVTYDDTHNDLRLGFSRKEIAELPTIRRGTLGSAIQILHVMGVRTIHMVGFDGGCHHAEGFQWRTRLRADHGSDYNAIRSAAIDAAFILGIALKFHNTDHNMENNGRKYVRFLKNAAAQAVHYSRGEIASFSPIIAGQLVSSNAAEYFEPPTQREVEVETAVLPVIQAEKAVIIQTKKAKKKGK